MLSVADIWIHTLKRINNGVCQTENLVKLKKKEIPCKQKPFRLYLYDISCYVEVNFEFQNQIPYIVTNKCEKKKYEF